MQALESYYYPSNIGLHTVREERGRGREGRGGGGEEGEGGGRGGIEEWIFSDAR